MGKKMIDALEQEKVIARDLVMRCDGERTLFTFDLLALRRRSADEPFIHDEASVLERRLRRIFPEMSPPRIIYADPEEGGRWRRKVEFDVDLGKSPDRPAGYAREYQGIIQAI